MLKLLLLLSVFGCFNCQTITTAYYDEVKDLPNHPGTLLVDVRQPSELAATGQIPSSINIPRKTTNIVISVFTIKERNYKFFVVNEVEKAFSEETTNEDFMKRYHYAKPTKSDPIIVYCRSGRRSLIAAKTLASLGYERLVFMVFQ